MFNRYEVEVVSCHACAAKERRARTRNENVAAGAPVVGGELYIVRPED